jgi:hypothetical protein
MQNPEKKCEGPGRSRGRYRHLKGDPGEVQENSKTQEDTGHLTWRIHGRIKQIHGDTRKSCESTWRSKKIRGDTMGNVYRGYLLSRKMCK